MAADIDAAGAQAPAEAITGFQRKAIPVTADIGGLQQIDAMVRQALAAFGHIDILVNNAAAQGGRPRIR